MRNVRLPKGAQVSMSRDDFSRSSGGGGVGWWIVGILIAAAAFGSTDGTDSTSKTPTNHPTPTHSAKR